MTHASNSSPLIQWGDGDKTFVFLHYFGGAALSWQWVAQQMPDYHCVALNLPGFGGTSALQKPSLKHYADAVVKELERLDISDYILVGHSMGGKIALQIAAMSDRPPQQVILIAPSPPTQEPMPAKEKKRLLQNHPSKDNAETTVKSATCQPLTEAQYAVAIETHIEVDNTAWRWWLLEGMNHSIADQMPNLQVPVTVLASQDDPIISYDTIQTEVINVIPQANLISIQGVGHLIPLEAPEWVATQVRQAYYLNN